MLSSLEVPGNAIQSLMIAAWPVFNFPWMETHKVYFLCLDSLLNNLFMKIKLQIWGWGRWRRKGWHWVAKAGRPGVQAGRQWPPAPRNSSWVWTYAVPHSTPPDPLSSRTILIMFRGSPDGLHGEVITRVKRKKEASRTDSLGVCLKTGLLLFPELGDNRERN